MLLNTMNSPQLKSLSDAKDLGKEMLGIFTEIKMLTGAILHEGEEMAMQVDVLIRFLVSSPVFASLTVNEIKHAFHMNQQGEYGEVYKHYNKPINGEFMGNVLLAYVDYKKQTSRRVHGDLMQLMYPKEITKLPIPTVDEYMQVVQRDYDLYRDGKAEYILFHLPCYNLLRKVGFISIRSRAHWQQLYVKAMHDRHRYGNTLPKNLKDTWERSKRQEVRKVYDEIIKTQEIPQHEHRILIHHIRKKLYMRFFKWISDCAINNIFQEIEYKL